MKFPQEIRIRKLGRISILLPPIQSTKEGFRRQQMGEDAMDANAQEPQGDDTECMENDKGEFECEMETSLDGTKQWLPKASPEETPYVGQQFKTAEEGILFYQAYAKAVGFDVRHNTMRKTRDGEVAIKYMVCSREGFKPVNIQKTNAIAVGTVQKKRRRVSKRVGCKARIVITRCPQGG
ncbi:protein FAR1-RELATED SEQUENCE 6-like [Ipomoea triloba]|uniref:protein FAR1-RELATED SEQUENCE 6-like n=1 Tax=Ipomoea triloba TaxID=35885 RepID=UPI00125E8B01|nr:protein FAR1-RELATED SEQUENCE 6-like [Ipomoea triloba]